MTRHIFSPLLQKMYASGMHSIPCRYICMYVCTWVFHAVAVGHLRKCIPCSDNGSPPPCNESRKECRLTSNRYRSGVGGNTLIIFFFSYRKSRLEFHKDFLALNRTYVTSSVFSRGVTRHEPPIGKGNYFFFLRVPSLAYLPFLL